MRRFLVLIMVIGLLGAGCSSSDDTTTTTTTSTTSTAAPTTTTSPTTTATPPPPLTGQLVTQAFGALTEVPLIADGMPYAGATHPTSLADVILHDELSAVLDGAGATRLLTELGFVIIPGDTRHFHHIYEGAEYAGYPVYVTTDTAYHVWHLAFDKILREAEQRTLLPELETMLSRLVELARNQESQLAGTSLEDASGRVRQFYEAAATLAGLDVGPIGPLAEAEVELALAADQIAFSPTIGDEFESESVTVRTDYTLFRPRGHYTRNADLERYFRAMSQLGNNAFLVNKEGPMQLALLATNVLLSDPAVMRQWQHIYEPTAFLVGLADDYTPFEVNGAVQSVVPTGWDDLMAFADDATVAALRDQLVQARPVRINPEAASVRIMGARFVIDSFIFDQLVMPNISDRGVATPLDLAATMGSTWAYATLDSLGETDYPHYPETLADLTADMAARTIDDWGQTVYDAWLYALEPMFLSHGDEFPDYMRTAAWSAKAHQTGFGSYAELKHDTILYTKQAVAEGGGDEPPVPPRHWVEPDPVAFERLAAVTRLMHTGLDSRDLLPSQYSELLDDLEEFLMWLAAIARDELAGIPISEDDNRQLSWIGGTLESFWLRTSDFDLDFENGPDSHAALIADIMRSGEDAVLEVGTGYIDRIFVLVPRDDGVFQVAVGGVYSYYEFLNEQRLTDEEWRALLAAGEAPARPIWQQPILSGDLELPESNELTAGLLCRDVLNRGFGFWTAAAYWISEGSPARMDADGNGIPCETVFPRVDIDAFLSGATDFASDMLCADLDLQDEADEYSRAVAYWMLEGTPARMDADGNGIPCETVFAQAVIEDFMAIRGG